MPKSTQICYWNQPALNNEGKVSCSMKQGKPMMGSNDCPTITSQALYPKSYAALLINTHISYYSMCSYVKMCTISAIDFEHILLLQDVPFL